MARHDKPLRPEDVVTVTRQKRPHEKPDWSFVARLVDDNGKVHTRVGLGANPGQIVKYMRYDLDNPYIPPAEDDI